MNAVFIIDKPAGLTSHDVVNRVRRVLGQRSVGHLGTLDPSATGVLPIVVGSFTRLAQFYMHSEKTYEGTIRFGFSTDTYDADGSPTSKPQPIILDAEKIHALAAEFQGTLEQVPPPFSAKKIAGVPAYKFARRQQEVTLKPVAVEIKEFTILLVAGDRATFYARVGSGTYIRSIAHDMGKRLRCGGHLAELRRTAVAEFNIEEACTLEELGSAAEQGTREGVLAFSVHPRRLLANMPCVTVTDESAALIRSGRGVNLPELSRAPRVKVFCGQRDFLAIATRVAGTLFHPSLVFSSISE